MRPRDYAVDAQDRVGLPIGGQNGGPAMAQNPHCGSDDPCAEGDSSCRDEVIEHEMALMEDAPCYTCDALMEEDPLTLICEIMWPSDDPDIAWSADTLDEVARVLIGAGYGPYGVNRV